MKICLVSPFPPPYGGMAIQAEKLTQRFEESGIHVIQIRTNVIFPKFLSLLQKIPIARTVIGTFLFIYELNKVLSKVNTVYFLTAFFNFFFWVTCPAIILIKLRGKKLVLSARGGGAGDFFNKYKFRVWPFLKCVDLVTVPSGFLQKAFIDAFGIQPVIVPNIIDLKQFNFKERVPIRPKLLVTRNLEKIYNIHCVIRSFNIIKQKYPDSRLGIAGEGSERQELEDLVNDLGLAECVEFYGRVEHDQIQELYDEYDIFVNGSNIDNLPGTILEAFACGLPVVSTNAGGIPYMVEDSVTGLLVETNDHEALAKNIDNLLNNPALVQKLTENARKECHKYSWENVKKNLLPFLQEQI